jgi:hypothetical protein
VSESVCIARQLELVLADRLSFRCTHRLLSDHRKSLVREWAERATERFVELFREENPASADNARRVRVACAESGTSRCPLRGAVSVDKLRLQGAWQRILVGWLLLC